MKSYLLDTDKDEASNGVSGMHRTKGDSFLIIVIVDFR
jgi:hypothetical protein